MRKVSGLSLLALLFVVPFQLSFSHSDSHLNGRFQEVNQCPMQGKFGTRGGCCSYHGGIFDCVNGFAVCSDGWLSNCACFR